MLSLMFMFVFDTYIGMILGKVRDDNGSDFGRIRFLAPSLLDLDFFLKP